MDPWMALAATAAVLTSSSHPVDAGTAAAEQQQHYNSSSSEEEDDHYDFCLLLQPQEVYAFWAHLLDFRAEFLGQHAVELMDQLFLQQLQQLEQKKADTQQDDDNNNNNNNNDDLREDDVEQQLKAVDTAETSSYSSSSPTSRDSLSSSPISTNNAPSFDVDNDGDDHGSSRIDPKNTNSKDEGNDDDSNKSTLGYTDRHNNATMVGDAEVTGDDRDKRRGSQSSNSVQSSKGSGYLKEEEQNDDSFSPPIKSLPSTPPPAVAATKSILKQSSTVNLDNEDHDQHSKPIATMATPATGLRRRLHTSVVASPVTATKSGMINCTDNHDSLQPTLAPFFNMNSERNLTAAGAAASSKNNKPPYSVRLSSKKSVFERAIGTPERIPPNNGRVAGNSIYRPSADPSLASAWAQGKANAESEGGATTTAMAPPTTVRRRWGNQAAGQHTHSMISPPIRSLTRGASISKLSTHTSTSTSAGTVSSINGGGNNPQPAAAARSSTLSMDQQQQQSHVIQMEDIPPQRFARGIAARTNCLLPFLSALKRGIVLRKHRPGREASFCKLVSHDGGDTIKFIYLDDSHTTEVMQAFKEQRVRYNKIKYERGGGRGVVSQPWSVEQHDMTDTDCSVPDFVAARKYRENMSRRQRGVTKKVEALAAAMRSGSFKAYDIAAVHRGVHHDPRSKGFAGPGGQPLIGTPTLRKSKSEYKPELTFSVILRADNLLLHRGGVGNSTNPSHYHASKVDEYEQRWLNGEGSEALFKYHDFEAATVGEYWLVFRGFLLLHRDAALGRFAEHRTAGIGSHYSRLECQLRHHQAQQPGNDEMELYDRLHEDEFHEPVTVGCLERLIVRWRGLDTTYMEGYTLSNAVPPPSDYFLGFRSPGTAIWSRLRLAGLQTCRVYNLDPKSVLIKIRCPPERLMDVAEVLRLKMKTADGKFVPFLEDLIDVYESIDDPLDKNNKIEGACAGGHGGNGSGNNMINNHQNCSSFTFRSSIRQHIIDFIVGSRIRDSGAELGQTTDLGKMIQARVPLHMHGKLNAIYYSWFYFWEWDNWTNGRDGRSMTHAPPPGSQAAIDAAARASHCNAAHSMGYSTPRGDGGNYSDAKKHDGDFNSSGGPGGGSGENGPPERVPGFFSRFFCGAFYQPLDSIEQYFGEKVAFYFAWLQHTASHLVVLTVAGLIMFACQLKSGNWDHPMRPFFSCFVQLWTFFTLVNWRKRQNYLAYRWGTMNYEEQETTRPEFRGEYTADPITGEWVVTYPKWKRYVKYMISFPLTIFFTAGTLILILWVHANRDLELARYMDQKKDPNSDRFRFDFAISAIGRKAPIVDVKLTSDVAQDPIFWFIVIGIPATLGLYLPLLNFVLMKISVMLTEFENYRTESEYRTFLIIKVFSFRFVCYFATLYYYAVISVGSEQAIENGILRVATGVMVYTTVTQWWQYLLQTAFPILISQIRKSCRSRRLCAELKQIEMEEAEVERMMGDKEICGEDLKKRQIQLMNKRLLLEQAQDDVWNEVMLPQHDSFPGYIQAVVQFTYVSCFTVVLPITPFICLFNHLLCMRLDAFKLCRGRQRPLAEKTGGIGVWEHVLHIVAVISVLTNCWLMGFTTAFFSAIGKQVGQVGLFAIVVCWEHIMLLIKYAIQTTVSALPKSVRDAMKKEQFELDQERSSSMCERRLQHQRDDQPPPNYRYVPRIQNRKCSLSMRKERRVKTHREHQRQQEPPPSPPHAQHQSFVSATTHDDKEGDGYEVPLIHRPSSHEGPESNSRNSAGDGYQLAFGHRASIEESRNLLHTIPSWVDSDDSSEVDLEGGYLHSC